MATKKVVPPYLTKLAKLKKLMTLKQACYCLSSSSPYLRVDDERHSPLALQFGIVQYDGLISSHLLLDLLFHE